MNLEIGSIAFEKFEILEFRGSGGNGYTYKARQIHLDKIVVLKVISVKGTHNRRIVRFHNEAKILSQLVHPNISQFLDFGISEDNNPYLAIEFIDGKTLRNILDEVDYLDIDIALKIAGQICGAIDHAHKKGIVHRDIKPSNLIIQNLSTEPRAILLDFGIAKLLHPEDTDAQGLTPTGDLVGSPTYMSPEQTSGKEITEKTDQYSLGCVLFEMLSGMPPFSEATSLQTIARKSREKAPLISSVSKQEIPDKLEKTLEKMLSIKPSERFDSIGDLVSSLNEIQEEQILEQNIDPEEEKSTPPKDKKHGQQRKFIIIFSLLSLPVLAVFVLILFPVIKTHKSGKITEKFVSVFEGIDQNEKNQTLLTTFEEIDKGNESLRAKPRVDISKKTFLVPGDNGILDFYPNLQEVKFKVLSDLSKDSFKKIKKLENLIVVEVLKTEFLIPSIKDFSGQKYLQVLNLNDTTIGDIHLNELENLPTLRYLNIKNTKVTENGLPYLEKIPGLKRVEVSTPLLSTKTIAVLRKKMPACEFSDGKFTKKSLFEELKQKEIDQTISKLNGAEASARHYKKFWKNSYNLAVQSQGKNSYAAIYALDQMIQYDIFFGKDKEALRSIEKLKGLCEKMEDIDTLAHTIIRESDLLWKNGQLTKSIKLAESAIPLLKAVSIKSEVIRNQTYNRLIDRLVAVKEYDKAADYADRQYKFAIRWLPDTDENIGVACVKALQVCQTVKNADSKYGDRLKKYANACVKQWRDRRAKFKPENEKDIEAYIEALNYLSVVEPLKEKREKLILKANKLVLENPAVKEKIVTTALGVIHRTANIYEQEGKTKQAIEQYQLLIRTADKFKSQQKQPLSDSIKLQIAMRQLYKDFLVRTGDNEALSDVTKEIESLEKLLRKHSSS